MDSDFNFNSASDSSRYENMQNRSGVNFIELFFDAINYFAGYHPLNNFEEKQHAIEDMCSFVLVLDGLDYHHNLRKFKNTDTQKYLNWRNHIACRTISRNNNRTHFPIILNTSDQIFFL